MPIYAYKCESCGFSKDVLQKISDTPLTDCPTCGAPAFVKQLTAAGFQLKGSGWYVTDFKGGAKPAAPAAGDKPAEAKSAEGAPQSADTAATPKTPDTVAAKIEATPASAPAASGG